MSGSSREWKADKAEAELDEGRARALCLLRACEDGPADAALWSPEDAAWASRAADETAGHGAGAAAWLAERARHAQQRLLPRRAALARAYARQAWGPHWFLAAALAGLACGVLADIAGNTSTQHRQHIDLLASPVWVVVAWNLLVYAWIAVQAPRGLGAASPASPGPWRRGVQRWFAGAAVRADTTAAATPEQRFKARWALTSAPLAAHRAACLLHVAAAALAVGLVAGLYARALVLDYRISWQSTLLEPAQVHGLLSVLLAPASALAGIALPDAAAVAALRTIPPDAPAASAGAGAPWLHLLAATLAWAVIVPRLVLALRAAWASGRRAKHLPVVIDDAHSLKLLQTRRRAAGTAAPGVLVLPHGSAPAPAATLALRTLLAACFGETAALHFASATAYGDEDRPPAPAPAGTAWRIAFFDLAATPEPQAQGRFVEQLRSSGGSTGAAPVVMLVVMVVDESGYRQRLGATSPRLAERRKAWQQLADEAGVGLACVDLQALAAGEASSLAAARAALESALVPLAERTTAPARTAA